MNIKPASPRNAFSGSGTQWVCGQIQAPIGMNPSYGTALAIFRSQPDSGASEVAERHFPTLDGPKVDITKIRDDFSEMSRQNVRDREWRMELYGLRSILFDVTAPVAINVAKNYRASGIEWPSNLLKEYEACVQTMIVAAELFIRLTICPAKNRESSVADKISPDVYLACGSNHYQIISAISQLPRAERAEQSHVLLKSLDLFASVMDFKQCAPLLDTFLQLQDDMRGAQASGVRGALHDAVAKSARLSALGITRKVSQLAADRSRLCQKREDAASRPPVSTLRFLEFSHTR